MPIPTPRPSIGPRSPYGYSPIGERPTLQLPGAAKVGVWVVPNIEFRSLSKPGPGPGKSKSGDGIDVYAYGWYDYGARVGIWRILKLLDRYEITASIALNSDVIFEYPAIVDACLDRGYELLGHARTNSENVHLMSDIEEADMVSETLATIEGYGGVRPKGWLGPGLRESERTLRLLVDNGVQYVADWCSDDQPFSMDVAGSALVSVPYTVELNDIGMYMHRSVTGHEYVTRIQDTIDVLVEEGAESGRIMTIALHPFISGQPDRSKYLNLVLESLRARNDIWWCTGSEIASLVRADGAGAQRDS